MNIPLNIDWQQILLHLFNLIILIVGLYLLLYKPVRDFMEKRAAEYAKMDAETRGKLAEAETLEAERREQISSLQKELDERRQSEMKRISAEATAKSKEAEDTASRIISEAQETAERERQRILDGAQDEIAQLVVDATDRMLSTSDAFDEFLDAAERSA